MDNNQMTEVLEDQFRVLDKFLVDNKELEELSARLSVFNILRVLRAVAEGKIQAFVYDSPILRYLVNQKFKGELEVLRQTFVRQDYGIALATGSTLREPINRVLLQDIREPAWHDTLYRYLGG